MLPLHSVPFRQNLAEKVDNSSNREFFISRFFRRRSKTLVKINKLFFCMIF